MFKSKKNILIFCLLSFITGCNDKYPEKAELPIIDIVEGIRSKSPITVLISEVAENTAFIPLEATDKSIIGSGCMFSFSNKYIVVTDNYYQILLFNATGQFIRKIGSRGQGPGEYLNPRRIIIIKDEIFVWDADLNIVLCYDLQTGRYERKKHLEFSVYSMDCFNDSVLVFYTSYPYREENPPENFSHLHTLSLDFSTVCDLWNEKITNNVDEESRYNSSVDTYMKNGNLYIWDNTSIGNTVFYFDKEMKRIPAYKLFIGKYDAKGKESYTEKFKPEKIIETDKFMFIRGLFYETDKFYVKHILYNKATKESKNVHIRTDTLDIKFYEHSNNNIPFWPDGYVSQNVLYSYFYTTGISQQVLSMLNAEKYKTLKNYMDFSEDVENPIIFLAIIKK
jgi:hypothetical protein